MSSCPCCPSDRIKLDYCNFIIYIMYLLCVLRVSTESHSHEFGEVMHYQVVRPVRLHSLRKRGAEVC